MYSRKSLEFWTAACNDLGKVSSPGLNLAVQSLLIGKSSLIGGEAWLPALVEALMIAGRKQGIFCH